MLSNEEDFHPDDYEATVNPSKQKPVIFTIENTIQFLREQGVDPETLKLIQQQCSAQAGYVFKTAFPPRGKCAQKSGYRFTLHPPLKINE